jgi:autotransporter-associated beta strand protein
MTRIQPRLQQSAHPLLTVMIVVLLGSAATGQTTTYIPNAGTSGNWQDPARWDNGVPNAVGVAAVLNQPISTGMATGGTYTLSLMGVDTTVGSLTSNNASDPAQSFRTQITNGRLIFENSAGPATLNENLGASTEIESRMRITVPVQLNSDLVVNSNQALNRNTHTELTQRIDGSAARTITKEGFGNLQLAFSGALAETEGFFGNVLINNGGIRLIGTAPNATVSTVFSKAAGVTVMAGGQFQFGNMVANVSLAPGAELKLNGAGKVPPAATQQNDGALRFEGSAGLVIVCTFNSPVNLQSDSHINVGAIDATGVLAPEVRGVGQLQKTGAGLLVLNAANVYSGGTAIMNGSIAVNNVAGSGVGTGDIAVTGGTLGGTGVIGSAGDPSNITLTGGFLSPGTLSATTEFTAPSGLITGPGVLTAFGNLMFDNASSLNIDLTGATVGSEYDQVVTNGAVSLGGAALNLSLGSFVPAGTESFRLIDNTGASPIVGEFANLTQGAAVDLAGVTYYMNYMGGNGNDVVLSPTQPTVADADFDGDGDVDGADFLTWQQNVGAAGGQQQGNANGDATIDGADLDIWRNQFGAGAAVGAVAAVPEPAAAILMLAASIGLALAGRRRDVTR